MNVYIDMDKVASMALDRMLDKLNVLAPSFTLDEDQRQIILENMKNPFADNPDDLEDLLETLMIWNFEENTRTTLASLSQLLGGNNND